MALLAEPDASSHLTVRSLAPPCVRDIRNPGLFRRLELFAVEPAILFAVEFRRGLLRFPIRLLLFEIEKHPLTSLRLYKS